MADVFELLTGKAKHTNKKIILTETEDSRIIEAAKKAADMDLCKIILLGSRERKIFMICINQIWKLLLKKVIILGKTV